MESTAVGAATGGGAELETSQPPLPLPGSRSDLAVWKRKVFLSLQREREILWFKARKTGTLWRVREIDTELEDEEDRESVRVTSRGLISEVNHFEQQRESPGWKISEQED